MDFSVVVDSVCSDLKSPAPERTGTLVRVVGMTLEARGILAPVGALCRIESANHESFDAEVVGFHDEILYLMPFTDPSGAGPGARVRLLSSTARASIGDAQLGRILDGLGRPLDGKPAPIADKLLGLQGLIINPMERGAIETTLDVGVKTINSLLTLGRGQRIGLMAGSGVGKSVLLGMMTKYTNADIVVIGLIGERGREVKEFITETLGPDGLAKSIVVASPANESPVLRLRATLLAHLMAEYWRDQGKNVLLLVDSMTRVAHAQREIGLAVGEPPTSKGYPPSVFALLPKLIERSGVGRHGHGSITAIYTVLAEGDDRSDPIIDITRASLDGQVMLSRELADAAFYPAIDLTGSVSRLMNQLMAPDQLEKANYFRRLWALYQQNKDLIQVGAYEHGANPELDEAIQKRPLFEAFMQQDASERFDIDATQSALNKVVI
ncbi:MAG TPA: flagellum-specific ATP synthase FliI [Gammaproteobacteria bacterium]|nr:flagellum-specific ATP synthase FliI [Gammaproteobacteria bacterium]